MPTITVRGLDQQIKARLRLRAARHGRSMEAEIRAILREVLSEPEAELRDGLGSRIQSRFAAAGGVDLDLAPRIDMPRAADLE